MSLLAPASLLRVYVERQHAIRQGAWAVWVDAGGLTQVLFFIGCLSLIAAIISTIADVRRGG